jgi:RecB family endonuclease NucS
MNPFNCEDYEEINLTGSKSEMAEMIFRNPNLIEEGFKPLSREYQIPTGIIDILGKDKDERWVILELKRRRADLQAVSQLKRYVEYFKSKYGRDRVRGILVAPSLTVGAERLLKEENLEFKKLNPPKGSKKDLKQNMKSKKTAVLDEWL